MYVERTIPLHIDILFISGYFFIKRVDFEYFKDKILRRQEAFRINDMPRQLS